MRQILFHNRYTKSVEEERVTCGKWLQFLYSTALGELNLFLLFRRKIFSSFLGWKMNRPSSVKKIPRFIKKNDLRQESFEKKIAEFTSFNDFFIRKLKPYSRPISPQPNTITAPSDGRHLAFENIQNLETFFVKGEKLSAQALIKEPNIAKKFANGSLLISRLAIADYHRFHFPLDCTPEKTFLLNGQYNSVHPLAMNGLVETFLKNKRMSTLLHTEKCGDVLMIEIGATSVGSIKQTFTPEAPALKGAEKGYFEFGGSTVMLIFEKDKMQFSEDLLQNTAKGLETYILMGDEIGTISQP